MSARGRGLGVEAHGRSSEQVGALAGGPAGGCVVRGVAGAEETYPTRHVVVHLSVGGRKEEGRGY